MAIDPIDRCPKCGAPYMSMLKPGEPPESRHCYTCENTAAGSLMGANQQAAAPGGADPDDELALQPLEGETLGGKRAGKLSPRGLGARRYAPPAPKPPKPASQSSRAVIPAAAPADAPARQTSAAKLTPAAKRASAAGIPAAQAGASFPAPGQTAEAGAGSWHAEVLAKAKRYGSTIAIGVVVLVAGLWLYGKMSAPAPAVAVADKPPEKKASQEDPGLSRKETAAPVPKVVEPAAEVKPDAPKVETKAETKTAAQPEKKEPEKRATNVAELLRLDGPRRARNAKGDDDEPDVKAPAPATKTAPPPPKPPDKDQAGEKDPAEQQEAVPTPATETKTENTEKKEDVDAAAALGLKKKDPKEGAKPAGPAPVTATVPTILPVDVDAMSAGNDKSFTQQISGSLPGWRVKDINAGNSVASASHRGRADAIGINPMNDVLPAKLSATVEIPAKARPRLMFEMASKDGGHEFLLAVKVWGAEVVPKTPVRTKDPLAWQDVTIDLSRWAGQRLDVVFEIYIKPKTPQNKLKEQIAYFRNIRLDWPGKPQATPAKPNP